MRSRTQVSEKICEKHMTINLETGEKIGYEPGEHIAARDMPPENVWIIDSSASRHMTPNESLFVSKQEIRTTVTVADGEESG